MAGTEILIGLAISAATSVVTSLLTPKQKLLPVDKGRFDDIRIQGSEYGGAIPMLFGRSRMAGNVIWSDGVQPHVTTTSGRTGKGGGGRPAEPPTNNYSYTTNLAIAICEGPLDGGLKRIWENAKVTLNNDASPIGGTIYQAELTTNTLAGNAQIVRDLSAQSEYKVQLNTGSLTFNNIVIPATGSYNINVSYSCLGAKVAKWRFDAEGYTTQAFPSTGSNSVFVSLTIVKTLTAGTHTLQFAQNNSDPTPTIDAVAINSASVTITPTSVTGIVDPDADFPADVYDPSLYYNARLVADDTTGTASAIQFNRSLADGSDLLNEPPILDDYPDQYPLPGGGGGGSTIPGNTGSGGTSFGNITFYNGSETQLPDNMMETADGVGNVPAYRGVSYITFRNYQIPNGQMPNFSFEVDEGTHDLAAIMIKLWAKVGLPETQLDVSALVGTFVEGLVIQSRTPLNDILDTLSIAFAFDFVDLDGKVTAVKRGGLSVVTLTEGELRAHEDGSEIPVGVLEGTYVNVEELPKQIDVSFIDRAKDYHQNVQPALKQIGYTEEPQTLTLPIVLSANQAQEIGLRVLNTVHLQRSGYGFTLPPKYAYLSPTDVVTVVMPNATYKFRIINYQTGMPGLCKAQAVVDSASLYNNVTVEGDSGTGTERPPISFPANTELTLMDIQPLFPEHTGFGFYAAACGKGIGEWYGAHLYKEEIPSSGAWERLAGFEVPATMGLATNSLSASPTISGGFDVTSSIVVQMYNGTLESYTTAEIDANEGLNLAYIGGEIVQFATAVIDSTTVYPFVRQYTITNFKRGLNGTTGKIAGHVPNEKFVFFNNAVKYIRQQAGQLYLNYNYKAVSIGQPLIGAETSVFNTGVGSAPPYATNLVLTQFNGVSPEGVSYTSVKGTFQFGSYVGGQRARVLIIRPSEVAYSNTGILVSPDANNAGAFEVPTTVNGNYTIKIVTISPFDHQLPETTPPNVHLNSTISISANNPVPSTPTAPVPTFDGQMVTWTWTASTDPRHAYYQFATGAESIIASRVDQNTYTEYPTSGMQRKVRSVNNQGNASVWSTAGTFTMPTPATPTGYAMQFDGIKIIHSWTSNPAFSYEIGDSGFTVIGASRTGQWIEATPPSSRSITRYLRAVQYGAVSAWTSAVVLTISAPAAPTSVTFNTASATPFEIPVTIVKPAGVNRDWIKRTIVEVLKHSDSSVLYTLYYSGVAESVLISGRYLDAASRQIRVRATYEDFIGVGTSATTGSPYTFIEIAAGDIDDDAIETRHISDDAIISAHITDGILNTAHFAAGIRPVQLYSGSTTVLPALPDATNYPAGSTIFWTNAADVGNQTLWKTVSGGAGGGSPYYSWTKTGAGSFAELTGTISAGQIASGTITDSHINAASNFSRITQSNMQTQWSGGGTITWSSSTGLTWSARFISIPNALASDGFFSFTPRTIATLTANWQGLYRRVAVGASSSAGDVNNITTSTAASGWFVVTYGSYIAPPSGYVDYLLAYINGDTSTGTGLRCILADGRIINDGQTIDAYTALPIASINGGLIATGALDATKFAAGIRPVQLYSASTTVLPTLPDANYPSGSIIYWTNASTVANKKLWRNNAGTWETVGGLTDIAANSITAGYISAGAIGATEIAANAIRTTHLLVGNFDNMCQDGGFESFDDSTAIGRTWSPQGTFGASSMASIGFSTTTSSPRSGSKCMQRTAPTGGADIAPQFNLKIPVAVGQKYSAECYVKSTSGTGTAGIRISFWDSGNSNLSASEWTVTAAASAGAWTLASSGNTPATAPANSSYMTIDLINRTYSTGTWFWDDVVVRRQSTATMIEDGAITTDKIIANAVTATQIAADAVTATKIAAGAVTAQKLSIGSFGTALNNDTEPADITAWHSPHNTSGNSTATPTDATIVTVTETGNVTNKAIRSNTGVQAFVSSRSVAFDINKQYRATLRVRKSGTANGTFYAGIAQFYGNDSYISHDYALAGGTVPATTPSWTDYTVLFGYNTANPLTTGCRRISIIMLINYTGTLGYMEAQNIRIEEMVTGTIIQGNTITTGHIQANAITANEIAAGAITAAKIQAGAVTAEKLAVGMQTGNLAINPSFEGRYTVVTGDYYQTAGVTAGTIVPEGWRTQTNNATSVTAASQSITPSDGAYVLKLVADSNDVLSKAMPVTAGATYLVRVKAYGNSVSTGFTVAVREGTSIDANGYTVQTSLTVLENNISLSATWGEYGTPRTTPAYYTVPAGITYISLHLRNSSAGTAFVDDVVVTKQLGSTYIQNGAITTDLIAANAIRAQNVQVGTFSESMQLNSKFVDAAAGYYHTVASGSNGTQIVIPASPAATDYSTGSDSSTPSEWTNITAVPYLQIPNTNPTIYGNWIPLDVNDTYYIEIWARTTSGTSTVTAGVYTDAGNFTGRQFATASVGTTWTKLSGVVGKTGTGANYKAWNDTTLGASTKFRFYVTTTSGVNVRFAQVLISRMQTGNLIVNGTITGTQIQAGSVNADRLVALSITAGQIQVGAIGADQIAARAIRADKLAIGVITDNLIPNPSFEEFDGSNVPTNWKTVEGSGTFSSVPTTTSASADGAYSLGMPNGSDKGVGTIAIPVIAGETYSVRFKIKTSSTTGTYYARMSEYNAALPAGVYYVGSASSGDIVARSSLTELVNIFGGANETMSAVAQTTLGLNTWVQKEAVYTVPAGIKYVSLAFYNWTSANGTVYIDAVDVRKQIRGVVIEDGTVTANKIVAQSITGTQIQGRSITADKIFTRSLADNQILNSGFELVDAVTSKPYNWTIVNGNTGATWSASTATASADGSYSLSLLNTSGTGTQIGHEAIPVTAGEKYYVSFKAKVPTATAGNFQVLFLEATSNLAAGKYYVGNGSIAETQTYDSFSGFVDSGTTANFGNSTTTSTYFTTSWKKFEAEYTIPAGVKYVTLILAQGSGTNPIYWDSVIFRKYITGVSIEDNTIRAPKIVAGSITADKIAVGAVGANLILNPSFEDHTSLIPSGWIHGDGTATSIVSSTDYVADGAYSGKIANGATTAYVSVAFPVVSTDTYIIRFKLRSQASAGTYTVTVNEYNTTLPTGKRYIGNHSNGEVITRTSSTSPANSYLGASEALATINLTTLNGGFVQKECTYKPFTGSKYISLSFGITGANGALYIDDVVVMKKQSGVFIENGTISAENLIIGGLSDNLIANGNFQHLVYSPTENMGASAWAYYATDDFSMVNTTNPVHRMQVADEGGTHGVTSKAIAVSPNTKISIRFLAYSSFATTANVKFLFRDDMGTANYGVRNYIGTGSETSIPTSAVQTTINYAFSATTSPTYFETSITVPANKNWMSVALTGEGDWEIYYEDIVAKKQIGAAFISNLRADQIVANVGQIGLVFADQIRQSSYTPYETGSVYDLSNGADGVSNSGWDETNASATTYDLGTDTLSWTGTTSWDNTGTVTSQSWQTVKAGTNGYFEFAITEAHADKVLGGGLSGNLNFGTYGAGTYYYAIDYTWVIIGVTAYIYESSTQTFNAGTTTAGDVYRVAVEDGFVRFRKNGRLVWTSPRKPATGTIRSIVNPNFRGVMMFAAGTGTQTIAVRALALTQEGTGQGWRLNPLTGTQTIQAEPIWANNVGEIGTVADGGTDLNVGNEIKKHTVSSTTAWDTSVTTDQTISAGDGYIQAIPNVATISMFGLSSNATWTNPAYGTLAYALFFIGGSIDVYENGTAVVTGATSYIDRVDVFRVAIEGTKVRYRKNGAVFYEHTTTPTYPMRAKVCLNAQGDRFSNISFTASSSGAGEFNSGITVRGRPIEDVVKLATTAFRADNRYRGNDYTVPSNQVTGVLYDTYYVSWEDDMWFANISVTVTDYKTNATRNMDSIKSVRTRIYDKTGVMLRQISSPWNGRGVVFSGFIPRRYADMKQEAVFSFEFENLYGYSAPIFYSEAKWLDSTAGTWIEASQGVNLSYAAPEWFNAATLPTECQAIPLTTTSVRVSWINANTAPTGNHNVFYRKFRADGYEGDVTDEGWIAGPTSVTTGTADITGLQTNTRYEFMTRNAAVSYSGSNIAHSRTFLLVPAVSNYGAPSALAGAASSTTNINLSWVKNDTTSYTETEIFYVTGTGVPTASDTQVGTGFTGTTASQGSLTANTTYTFRARNSYNAGANYSDWSNAVTVTTQATANNTLPTNVSAIATGYYSISVNWTSNGGATTHRVQVTNYGDVGFASPVFDTNNTTKPRPVGGLLSGTSYRVRVSADNGTTWSTQAIGSTYEYDPSGPGRDCILETEMFTHVLPNGDIIESPAKTIKVGNRAVGSHAGTKGVSYAMVTQVKSCVVNKLYTVKTALGHSVKCSDTHKPITSWNDRFGTQITFLETGNLVLVYDKINGTIVEDIITEITIEIGEFNIIKFSLDSEDHTYIGGGIVAHNRKDDIPY